MNRHPIIPSLRIGESKSQFPANVSPHYLIDAEKSYLIPVATLFVLGLALNMYMFGGATDTPEGVARSTSELLNIAIYVGVIEAIMIAISIRFPDRSWFSVNINLLICAVFILLAWGFLGLAAVICDDSGHPRMFS
jgi:asparagine N-glycosylation enzyme membrane subunit Stt3